MFAVGDRVKVVGKKSKKFDGALGVVDHDDTSFGGWVWATFAVVGRKAFTPDELAKVEVTVLEGSLYVGLHGQIMVGDTWLEDKVCDGENYRITIERVKEE